MKLKDYAPYYIGTPCYNTWFPPDHDTYDAGWVLKGFRTTSEKCYMLESELDITWTDSIKPILRRLEDMTEEEAIQLIQIMVPDEMEDKPADEEYILNLFHNDGGNLVNNDVAIGAEYNVRCYDGQVTIKKCGTICAYDETGDEQELVNAPRAYHYLLSRGFDLFGLISAGLAIDAKTITP